MIRLYAVSFCVAIFKKAVSKVRRGPLMNTNFYCRGFNEINIGS